MSVFAFVFPKHLLMTSRKNKPSFRKCFVSLSLGEGGREKSFFSYFQEQKTVSMLPKMQQFTLCSAPWHWRWSGAFACIPAKQSRFCRCGNVFRATYAYALYFLPSVLQKAPQDLKLQHQQDFAEVFHRPWFCFSHTSPPFSVICKIVLSSRKELSCSACLPSPWGLRVWVIN